MSYLNLLLTIAVINGIYQTIVMRRADRRRVIEDQVQDIVLADNITDATVTQRMRRKSSSATKK